MNPGAAYGAGCGEAIFINAANLNYASQTVQGNCTFSNSTVSANSGLGAAFGTDLFLYSYNGPPTAIVFAPGEGNTVTLIGTVADDSSNSIPSTSTWVEGQGSGSSLTMRCLL